MTLATSAKFRPVLTPAEISHICELCRRDGSDNSIRVLSALASFEWKIKSGAVTPAYIEKPRENLSSALGFHQEVQEIQHIQHILTDEALYAMWADDSSTLNIEQLKRVRTWRYTNNKMTVDEEKLYESEVLGFQ